MSNEQSKSLLTSTLQRYFPATSLDGDFTASSISGYQASKAVYAKIVYDDNERSTIENELARIEDLDTSQDKPFSQSKSLASLNDHLGSRTTLLGTKPSIADAMLYFKLAPIIKNWDSAERTGQDGYHHIVRHADFVQKSAAIGLNINEEEKIVVDPTDIVFTPRPLDLREEKERKKKEKSAAAAGSSDANKATFDDQKKAPEPAKFTKSSNKADASIIGDPSVTKRDKKEKQPKPQKQQAKDLPLSPALIDFRVGHILNAVVHPNADSLFVSTITVGDPPGTENTSEYQGQIVRTVCSGLNGLVPLEEMQNRKIVAVCNLKPVTMRGIKSAAMVLAASPRLAEGEVDNHAGPVELVNPPEGALAGQRILFEGWEGEPEPVLNPKKKIWDMCQTGFTTNESLDVVFNKALVEQLQAEHGLGKPDLGRLMVRGGGACKVKSLNEAVVR